MDVFEAIKKRHSYRGAFDSRPLPPEDLRKIVEAGTRAPSGKNAQTTFFIVVNDKNLLNRIGQMHTMKAMQTAAAMVVCVIDKKPEATYEGFSFQIEDCAAAVENMLLALTALGYASVWIDGWLRINSHAEKIGEILGLPTGKVVRVLLPIGVPIEAWPEKEKKSFEQRACFNHYQ